MALDGILEAAQDLIPSEASEGQRSRLHFFQFVFHDEFRIWRCRQGRSKLLGQTP